MRECIALICRLVASHGIGIVAKCYDPSHRKVCCKQIIRPVDVYLSCFPFRPFSITYLINARSLRGS